MGCNIPVLVAATVGCAPTFTTKLQWPSPEKSELDSTELLNCCNCVEPPELGKLKLFSTALELVPVLSPLFKSTHGQVVTFLCLLEQHLC